MNFISLFRREAVLVFFGLLGFTLLFHGGAVESWWCCDDSQILKHAISFSPGEYFFVPAAWRSLSSNNLTPWLTLAYDIDLALFGFTPRWFYVHNLLVIALCAYLLYLITREWLDTIPALGSAILFLTGVPMTVAAQQLMVRHYMEGMCFYLLAVWLVIRGVRRDQAGWGIGAAAAFAIAASAKEIYLPLGLLVFFLPIGVFRRRLTIAWPLLLIMGLYIPWRWYMLGEVLGGYTPQAELSLALRLHAFVSAISDVPWLLWTTPIYTLAAIGLSAFFALARHKTLDWGSIGWLFALPPLVLAPLIPLTIYPGLGAGSERYFIVIWTSIAVVMGVVLNFICKNRATWLRLVALAFFGMVLYPAWQATLKMQTSLQAVHTTYRAIGQAIADSIDNVIIVDNHTVPWFNTGIMDLRPNFGNRSTPPLLAADIADIASSKLERRRVLRYDPTRGAMSDITQELPGIIAAWRAKLRPIHLSINIQIDPLSGVVRWELNSDTASSYAFLEQGGQISLPPKGALRATQPPRGCFRIRLDSPEGWVAYSPRLVMPTVANQPTTLSWQGMTDMFDQPAGSLGVSCEADHLK